MDIATGSWLKFLQESKKTTISPKKCRQQIDEISQRRADEVMNWFGDDYSKLSFDELFDGKLRRAIPLKNPDAIKLQKIVNILTDQEWDISPDEELEEWERPHFPTRYVKQKLRRQDGGEEYDKEIEVADLRIAKVRTVTIPKGPRAGETITKTEERPLSRVILKDKSIPEDLKEWWRKKQTFYTKDNNWRQVEEAFNNPESTSQMMVILSRHPLDVLRMSDISNITSCHSEGHSHFECAIDESRGHGPIAYLVDEDEYEKLMKGDYREITPEKDPSPAADQQHKQAAEIWINRVILGQPKLYKSLATQIDNPEMFEFAVDAIKDEKRYGHDDLPVPVRGEITDEEIHKAVKAKITGGEWSMVKKDLDTPVEHWDKEVADYARWLLNRGSVRDELAKHVRKPAGAKGAKFREALRRFKTFWGEEPKNRNNGGKQEWGGVGASGRNPLRDAATEELFGQLLKNQDYKGKIAAGDISEFDNQEIFRDKRRDVEGIGAISRVRLRRFVDNATDAEFAVPEKRIYGLSAPGFGSAVGKWAYDEQKHLFHDDGPPSWYDLSRSGGSYEDNEDGTILNLFFGFDPDVDSDPYSDYDNVDNENPNRYDEWVEQIEEIQQQSINSLEHCSFYAEVEDHGDGPEALYVGASSNMRVKVPLTGWKEIYELEIGQGSGWYPGEWVANKMEPVADTSPIPGWRGNYVERNHFQQLIEWEYPDETEWEVDQDTAGRPYLEVQYSIRCDDCGEPDDVSNFLDFIKNDWDDKYDEIVEKVRRALVEGEYIEPNKFDKTADSKEHAAWAAGLGNFTYIGPDDDGEMIFKLVSNEGAEHYIPTNVIVPSTLFPRITRPASGTQRELSIGDVMEIVGGTQKYFGIQYYITHTGAAQQALIKELEKLEQEANAYAARQLKIDFGDSKYDEPEDAMGIDFAKNVELTTWLVNDNVLTPRQVNSLPTPESAYLGFGMRITVHSVDTDEEIEGAIKFVEYIDDHIDTVKNAFETIYSESIEEYAEKKRIADEASVSKGTAEVILNALDTYSMGFDDVPRDDPRHNPRATAAKALILWFKEAWDDMMKLERRVFINHFLRPVQQASLNTVEPDQDNHNAPHHWDRLVKADLRRGGSPGAVVRSYKWKGPSYGKLHDSFADPESTRYEDWRAQTAAQNQIRAIPARNRADMLAALNDEDRSAAMDALVAGDREEFMRIVRASSEKEEGRPADRGTIRAPLRKGVRAESIEEEIMRIDKMIAEDQPLQQKIDLRIYKVELGVIVNVALSGTDSQIENQIRGIEGVTTVRHLTQLSRRLGHGLEYRVYEIKFELFGQAQRDEYRDFKLVPGIVADVQGIKVRDRGQVHAVERLSEWGGMGSGYGMIKRPAPDMVTPSIALEDVVLDWAEGGVQIYDVPMDANNMQYHVMMPVSELWPHASRYYRGSKTDFDGKYKHFIKSGAQLPVYVALGQNGRVKITGNEDLVWFAKTAGLEELPVFFSYQKQV